MSRKSFVPLNTLSGTSDPTTPTFRAGDPFYRTDTGRVRVYTGSAWTDAGLVGSTGPAGGQEIQHITQSNQQTLTVNSTYQDVTGLQISVPASTPCLLVLALGLSFNSSSALGTMIAPIVAIRDSANTVVVATNPGVMLPASGTVQTVKYSPLIFRVASQAGVVIYKASVNPSVAAQVSTLGTWTTSTADPLFLRAEAL